MNINDFEYFFIDIDGTLTDYRSDAMTPENMLGQNFLFPIIRDMMVEQGWGFNEAGQAITDEADRVIFWDYSDFIEKFGLCKKEAFSRMRQWHRENLTRYIDMVETVAELHSRSKTLFIISNNPYWGCRFKLEAAGVDHQCFKHIFGTNTVFGCKSSPDVWLRALDILSTSPEKIATIGDHPLEDGEIPQSCGIGGSFILCRDSASTLRIEGKSAFINNAGQLLL